MAHAGPKLIEYNGITIIHCHICGFAHQWPMPDDVSRYYEDDRFYKTHSPPDWFAKVEREHVSGLWKAAYDYQISKLVPTGIKKERLVDWGTGAGWFIEHWINSGGRAIGTEPSRMARDLSVVTENIVNDENHLGPEWENSHVRSSLVLEHLVSPRQNIRLMRNFVGMGKRLMIIVPNDFSPLQKRIGGYGFVSKVHINYFTPYTLKSTMEKLGFQIIDQGATFPMELFVLMGMDYRGNEKLGRKLHNFRLATEKRFGPSIFKLYSLLLKRFGWGRELIFTGVKRAI